MMSRGTALALHQADPILALIASHDSERSTMTWLINEREKNSSLRPLTQNVDQIVGNCFQRNSVFKSTGNKVPRLLYCSPMIRINLISLLLLLIYAVSLISCDVAEYAFGMDPSGEAALVTLSVNSGNDSSNPNGAATSADCPCVCHVPTLPAALLHVTVHTPVSYSTNFTSSFTPSAPIGSVYHPPKAS